MKDEKFNMRMSKETREKLKCLRKYYNLSASSVVDMLIAKASNEMKLSVISKQE